MNIKKIMTRLDGLNASAEPAKKPKKVAAVAVAAPKVNGHVTFTQDELLEVTAQRIVAALNLTSKGVTAKILVTKVREFEAPYEGVVQ